MPFNGRLRLRPVTMADAQELWRWRNDPSTRLQSFNRKPISFGSHERWLKKTLTSRHKELYLALDGHRKVGVVRFDIEKTSLAEVNITVEPRKRGRGYGKRVLRRACDFMLKKYPSRLQKALIKFSNPTSERIFSSAGFLKVHEVKEGQYSIWIRR